MFADTRLSSAMESMMRGIAVPPAPTAAIRVRMAAALPVPRRARVSVLRYAIAAAAVVALFCAVFPKASLALVDRFERIVVDSYAAAYKVMGWTPPSPPPKALERSISSERVTLAVAQSKVPFTIVVPSGVPSDATLASIHTLPVLIYDKTTGRWSKGAPAIDFRYRRAGKREFELMAGEDDPRLGPTSKYIYVANDLPEGKVELIKHERFQWKNGNQLTTAIEDDGISAAEIGAIRAAMHGEPIAHLPRATIEKQYLLAPP